MTEPGTQRRDVLQQGYPKDHTALLFLDPYNDFLAEGGKLWPRVQAVAVAAGLHGNLTRITAEVRRQGLKVFIVPHHRAEPGDLDHWDHPTPYQLGSAKFQVFAQGSWGGEWFPAFAPQAGDVVAKEHWGGSGFANTDLDFLLKQHRVTHCIFIGLIANTCVESTARFASELGYHVTLVRDATAAFSAEAMQAAHDINAPTYAHVITTTDALLAALAL